MCAHTVHTIQTMWLKCSEGSRSSTLQLKHVVYITYSIPFPESLYQFRVLPQILHAITELARATFSFPFLFSAGACLELKPFFFHASLSLVRCMEVALVNRSRWSIFVSLMQ
jgi:hypothetical protein